MNTCLKFPEPIADDNLKDQAQFLDSGLENMPLVVEAMLYVPMMPEFGDSHIRDESIRAELYAFKSDLLKLQRRYGPLLRNILEGEE